MEELAISTSEQLSKLRPHGSVQGKHRNLDFLSMCKQCVPAPPHTHRPQSLGSRLISQLLVCYCEKKFLFAAQGWCGAGNMPMQVNICRAGLVVWCRGVVWCKGEVVVQNNTNALPAPHQPCTTYGTNRHTLVYVKQTGIYELRHGLLVIYNTEADSLQLNHNEH